MHAIYDNKYYPLTRKMHGTTRKAHGIARIIHTCAYILIFILYLRQRHNGLAGRLPTCESREKSLSIPKLVLSFDAGQTKGVNRMFFQKKLRKHFVSSRKRCTFAFAFQKTGADKLPRLVDEQTRRKSSLTRFT